MNKSEQVRERVDGSELNGDLHQWGTVNILADSGSITCV